MRKRWSISRRQHSARQIFLPRLVGKGVERLRGKSLVNQIVSLANDMEVTIVADRRHDGANSWIASLELN